MELRRSCAVTQSVRQTSRGGEERDDRFFCTYSVTGLVRGRRSTAEEGEGWLIALTEQRVPNRSSRPSPPPPHRTSLLVTFHTRVLRATDEIEGERGAKERRRDEARQLISSFSAAAAAAALARSLARSPSLGHSTLGLGAQSRSAQTDRACVRAQCALQREFARSSGRSFVRWVGWLTGYHSGSGGGLTVAAIVRPAERNERRRATEETEADGRTIGHNKVSE